MLYPHLVTIVPMIFRHAKIGLQVVPPTGPGPRPISEAGKMTSIDENIEEDYLKKARFFIFAVIDWLPPPPPPPACRLI